MEYIVGEYGEFMATDNANSNNHFTVDDLLNFSKEDENMTDAFFENVEGNSIDSSAVTNVDSCNSSLSGGSGEGQFNGNVSCRSFNDSQFSRTELCVPYDDIAELEWLSNFVEESFSTDDLHFIPTSVITNAKTTDASSSATTTHSPPPPFFSSEVSVPGKARSKRSRAAPCDWSSRLLVLSASSDRNVVQKKREQTEKEGRQCLHCGSEKTPQWRTGPMGPKTLCNACGVRYKSGRLVPEYRPASSPTFVSTKHSNSHRKVLELRRQKEMGQGQGQGHSVTQHRLMGQASFYNGCDEFIIPRVSINGQDFRHMM